MEQNIITLVAQENTLRKTYRQELAAILSMTVEQNIKNGAVIGIVDIFNYDPCDLRAEFGILVGEEYRHQGFGRAIATALLDYCKNTIKLHQLYCDIAITNIPSLSLFKSIGFSMCGVMKQWTVTPEGWVDAARLQYIFD